MAGGAPKLLPVSVPWMISPSVPLLHVHEQSGKPFAVTFIGFFKCDENSQPASSGGVTVVHGAPEFKESSERGPYRMVRVRLKSGLHFRVKSAHSDIEVVPKDAFDWSEVTSMRREGETASQNVARTKELWLTTKICPNPRMYEVSQSLWVDECGLNVSDGWHHYLFLGHENSVEVIAKGWDWQGGQLVA